MTSIGRVGCMAGVVLSLACAPPKTPQTSQDLAAHFVEALREEAVGDPDRAVSRYLEVLDEAAAHPVANVRVAAVEAILAALLHRSVPALREMGDESALLFRTRSMGSAVARLTTLYQVHEEPMFRGLVARALERLAEHRGDATEADRWRRARGCAREGIVLGPIDWATQRGVDMPSSLDAYDAPLPGTFRTPGPLGVDHPAARVQAHGCALSLSPTVAKAGVREVVVDVAVPRRTELTVSLRARGAVVVRAGGQVLLRSRRVEAERLLHGHVTASEGRLRVVVRIGSQDDDTMELEVRDAQGNPVLTVAPKVGERGERAGLQGEKTAAEKPFEPKTEAERVLAAAAALASGDSREADRVLYPLSKDASAPRALLFARAAEAAQDLSTTERTERARDAYERVLEAWPGAWEAVVSHAVLSGARRAPGEAPMETLRDLKARREPVRDQPLVDAFEASVSARAKLFDRAHAAFQRARPGLSATPLFLELEALMTPLVGAERSAAACAPTRCRSSFVCYEALRAAGSPTEDEMARLRTLLGAPTAWLSTSVRDALAAGASVQASKAFDAMSPGDRTLSLWLGTHPRSGELPPLPHFAFEARDAPQALGGVHQALGRDSLARFEGKAERVLADERDHPTLEGAATAILAHEESYELGPRGLHGVLFDVRRVTGTTDVERNAQAEGPEVLGRSVVRPLRRRVFKRDGRVVEPDAPGSGAAQGHADLAQLEAGDAVEAIYEVWATPSATGDLGLDTPDLLAERTAVKSASVELRIAEGKAFSLWAHPLLGDVSERREGGARVLRWELANRATRRLEDSSLRWERGVGVSATTLSWGTVGRGLGELLEGLEASEPELTVWASDVALVTCGGSAAAPPHPPQPKTRCIAAVVEAAGQSVREAQVIDDRQLGRHFSARRILAEHQGSRSWVIARALRALGIPAEIALAESEPFSSSPTYPPHVGRFVHPLVLVRSGGAEVWIDADVAGAPLPAGHVSPELRGRSLLRGSGVIEAIPASVVASDRDEVDLRLGLQANGDARGELTLVLRGRGAQELGESLFRLVGAERQRALRSVVLGWVPFANVEEVALSSTEGSWQVALRATISVPGYAQREPRGWALPGLDPVHVGFPRPYVSTLGATLASQSGRESALAITQAAQYHVRRRIELPRGFSLVRAPTPVDVVGPSLRGSRRMTVSGATLEDDFVLEVSTGTVTVADYPMFVRRAQQIDEGFLASLWVRGP